MRVRILNCYAGIGGNRKLWQNVEVTAVELNPEIAKIYQDFFPNDKVIVTDAHAYLLEHFTEYDFIWSSPPCPTHSRMNHLHNVRGVKVKYPDMKLYEEILLLKHFANSKWVVENVKSYYDPLIPPKETARHYFWSNFKITDTGENNKIRNDRGMTLKVKMHEKGIWVDDFHGYDGDKRTLINNCIEPELALHILNCAQGILPPMQDGLFAQKISA